MNWPALAPELTGLPDAIDPGQFVEAPDHFGLAYTQGHAATVMVAASDTPAELKRLAQQKYRCDGVADDVQIQAAIDNLPAGGGEILLLVGSYLTDVKVTIPDNVVVRGQGPATVVRLTVDTGAGTTDGIFENADSVGGNSNITIRDMSIYCGSGVDSTPIFFDNVTVGLISGITADEGDNSVTFDGRQAVLLYNCDRILIENSVLVGFGDSAKFGDFAGSNPTVDCEIRNCLLYGAGSDGVDIGAGSSRIRVISNRFDASGSNAVDIEGSDCVVAENVILNPGAHGVAVDGNRNIVSSNQIVDTGTSVFIEGIEIVGSDNVVVGNLIRDFTYKGIRVLGDNNIVADNRIDAAGVYGIEISAASNCLVAGNHVKGSGQHGIYLSGACESNQISGNYVVDSSQDSAGSYDGVFVNNSTSLANNSIQGNTVRGSVQHRYGINVSGANATNTLVANNDLASSGATGAFNDAGTGTDILGGNRT